MELESLSDLYVRELQEVYDGEQQILRALPSFIREASTPELRNALEDHVHHSEAHIQRLEQILEQLGAASAGGACDGIEGIIREGFAVIGEHMTDEVRDAALLSAVQRIEHYELSSYETLAAYAEQLGYADAAKLLRRTADEERAADQLLTEISNTYLTPQALNLAADMDAENFSIRS